MERGSFQCLIFLSDNVGENASDIRTSRLMHRTRRIVENILNFVEKGKVKYIIYFGGMVYGLTKPRFDCVDGYSVDWIGF